MERRGKLMIETVDFDQIVYFVTGPGQFPRDGMCAAQGKVVQKIQTKFGYSLAVQVAGCARYEYCDSVTDVNVRNAGIGAYTELKPLC